MPTERSRRQVAERRSAVDLAQQGKRWLGIWASAGRALGGLTRYVQPEPGHQPADATEGLVELAAEDFLGAVVGGQPGEHDDRRMRRPGLPGGCRHERLVAG